MTNGLSVKYQSVQQRVSSTVVIISAYLRKKVLLSDSQPHPHEERNIERVTW